MSAASLKLVVVLTFTSPGRVPCELNRYALKRTMNEHKKTLVGSFLSAILSLCGCGNTPPSLSDVSEPTLVEEMTVTGFDSDGEPVIKTWSDGSIRIHFEAMPPFFSEENGTESEFENFEERIQDALDVSVSRDDREVFVIQNPEPDTAEKAKAWLQAFRENGG
jgi:hypothetical protein|nr:hypothetical protein [Planctomicrobium sp.]